MILGSVQPSYLAWLPLFCRMLASDVFVHLDDVEYSKNSFHNRNRLRGKYEHILLTVPVLYSGNSNALISEIEIDYRSNWNKKHLKTIQLNYAKAPYFTNLNEFLEYYYNTKWSNLADLNITFIEYLKDYLGIKTKTARSSNYNLKSKGNAKLIDLCKNENASHFIVKPGTEDYHPSNYFSNQGISFIYFNFKPFPYTQLHTPFIANLSILDFALNCGPNSSELIKEMYQTANSETALEKL
jgi:hypothetical protein